MVVLVRLGAQDRRSLRVCGERRLQSWTLCWTLLKNLSGPFEYFLYLCGGRRRAEAIPLLDLRLFTRRCCECSQESRRKTLVRASSLRSGGCFSWQLSEALRPRLLNPAQKLGPTLEERSGDLEFWTFCSTEECLICPPASCCRNNGRREEARRKQTLECVESLWSARPSPRDPLHRRFLSDTGTHLCERWCCSSPRPRWTWPSDGTESPGPDPRSDKRTSLRWLVRGRSRRPGPGRPRRPAG